MPIQVRTIAGTPTQFRLSMHGGTGPFELRFVYEDDDFSSALRLYEVVRLPAGASIAEHVHDETEEIYHVLSGTGTMVLDGEERTVTAGDVVLTTPPARHGIANPGPDDLEVLIVEVRMPPESENRGA